MEIRNGIHVIDCANISKPLKEIQGTEEFKIFADQFGNAMKLNGIVYLINTEVENDVVRKAFTFFFLKCKQTFKECLQSIIQIAADLVAYSRLHNLFF